jgi:hypothetical protein
MSNCRTDVTFPADRLLPRLERVTARGPGRTIARCPAHDDRTPSLDILELDDGTLLLKCHAGCSVSEIVAAVGLDLRDLFPPKPISRPPLRPHERWVPMDVLRCVAHEVLVVLITAEAIGRGELLSDSDRERLALAVGRVRAAVEEVGNG